MRAHKTQVTVHRRNDVQHSRLKPCLQQYRVSTKVSREVYVITSLHFH